MTPFELILKHIDDKVEHLRDAVCSERLTTFDEYKRLCGEIRGLRIAKELVLDVKQRVENEDD